MPKSSLSTRWLAAALVAQALAGCGAKHENRRYGDADAQAAAAPSVASADITAAAGAGAPTQAGATPPSPAGGPEIGAESSQLETPAPTVADKLNHAFHSFFYQGAAALADLFATPGTASTSMLCFPAAFAYQAEYRRAHAQAPETSLKDGSDKPAGDEVIGAQDVRFITDFCKADLKKGMTIPQGVGCISRLYTASSLKADLTVIGQDAQWSSFGMYPAGTKSELRSVTPGDLHALLKADASVIALVGAYVKDGAKLKRIKGHFISLTGYTRADGAPADQATINVVDPSADYAKRANDGAFDSYLMAPRPAELAPLLPEHAGFELKGFSLGVQGATVIVESIISFQ